MKKYLRIILICFVLCLVGILFALVRSHVLTTSNYFINFDDAEQVYELIASEFPIGETTKTDVEHVLNAGIFGDLDCSQHDFVTDDSDSQIYCDALASYSMVIPRFYLITLRFSEDVLVDIIVQVRYPNAP
jgi:hypothetical protein